jgi:hypothetical protein
MLLRRLRLALSAMGSLSRARPVATSACRPLRQYRLCRRVTYKMHFADYLGLTGLSVTAAT